METETKSIRFNFEDLEVWRKAVGFANEVIGLAEKVKTTYKHYRLIEHLESASASIVLKQKAKEDFPGKDSHSFYM